MNKTQNLYPSFLLLIGYRRWNLIAAFCKVPTEIIRAGCWQFKFFWPITPYRYVNSDRSLEGSVATQLWQISPQQPVILNPLAFGTSSSGRCASTVHSYRSLCLQFAMIDSKDISLRTTLNAHTANAAFAFIWRLFMYTFVTYQSFRTALCWRFRLFHRAQYRRRYFCVVFTFNIPQNLCSAWGNKKQQLVLKCLGMHVFICIALFLRYDQLPQTQRHKINIYISGRSFLHFHLYCSNVKGN